MNTITLSTAQLVTLTDGRLACTMDEVYKALNEITGDNLYTHQLPRAMEFAQPELIKMHPWVENLPDMPSFNGLSQAEAKEQMEAWVAKISADHGDTHEVPDLSEQWVYVDPIAELVDKMGGRDT
jgi:hypothetical protein